MREPFLPLYVIVVPLYEALSLWLGCVREERISSAAGGEAGFATECMDAYSELMLNTDASKVSVYTDIPSPSPQGDTEQFQTPRLSTCEPLSGDKWRKEEDAKLIELIN